MDERKMISIKNRVLLYQTVDGKAPFEKWINSLADRAGAAKVRVRIDRIRLGNFGHCRFVGEGVYELKIDRGPGYRVYYAQTSRTIVLLCGGDKKNQEKDIEFAHAYWADYKKRRHEIGLI